MNQKLQSYLLFLLSTRDYTQNELQSKSRQKGYESQEIEEVIAWLTQQNYINDQRYAENLIQAHTQTHGVLWLQHKLKSKGITDEVTELCLAEQRHSTQLNDSLKSMVETKYKVEDWNEIDPKTLQRIIGYISRRGFTNAWEMVKGWRESE